MTPEHKLAHLLMERFHTAVEDDGLCHHCMARELWLCFTLIVMDDGARPTELHELVTDLYAELLRSRERGDL
jgi:hypothetical protein